jgi:hypothetical protein
MLARALDPAGEALSEADLEQLERLFDEPTDSAGTAVPESRRKPPRHSPSRAARPAESVGAKPAEATRTAPGESSVTPSEQPAGAPPPAASPPRPTMRGRVTPMVGRATQAAPFLAPRFAVIGIPDGCVYSVDPRETVQIQAGDMIGFNLAGDLAINVVRLGAPR